MPARIFHPGPWDPGDELNIDPAEAHYLTRVRRCRVGEEVEVLDSHHGCHGAVVEGLNPCVVRLTQPILYPAPAELELWLGIPEPDATLESITGACELGVTQIHLVRCTRSHHALPNPQRIDRVIRAAQRQCGRPQPPTIVGPTPLTELVAQRSTLAGVIAWERQRNIASPPLPSPLPRLLLVGPEGGFAPDEARLCLDRGMSPFALGPWILRTPTAVVAGLSRLVAH